ncbi:translation initiation factor eIF4e [Fomitiporia mediterranea MF3/22]|uniref:translation initiation factor eIF4e n=1 Tax=Fomitiporia mediterranea (strain MF3/22) TaxID=694068 RepID=UPI00044089BA|nr:translation initiation factor eIF4e [Fomitiporia mediterranea MF3/22]EJD05453.1 translation initiation factor eIF4e [Fomitiporia mediterranea MF3/22]
MPPSLDKLAARITASGNAAPPSTQSSSARPRLAAQLLRTGSQISLTSTIASNADSTTVNPPTTRSVSPAGSSGTSSPLSTVPSGGDPLTTERVEKLNVETEKKAPVGYKNIPSLDAITARMQMTRSLSVDGTTKPPEPETYEDPATPGIPQKVPEHPLQNKWTIYHDSKSRPPPTGDSAAAHPAPTETGDYEAGLTVIGDFDTVESFCRYFNWLKPPSKLERNSNYHLFKTGIKPMWEDPANAEGGKWVLTMKNNPALLDRCWSWLAMAMIGEEFDDYGEDLCGAVVSLRSKVDRIQLWIRSKDDVERVNGIGRKLVKLLDVSEADGIGLEFQYNSEDRPPPNKFLSVHSTFPQSSFRSSFSQGHANSPTFAPGETPTSAGPGGAFSGFSTVGSGWRARR